MPKYERKAQLLAAGLTALITFLVYLPAVQNGFVNWDDDQYVYNNIHVRSLDWNLLHWAFSGFYASNWHPLTWLSHAGDYAVWGLNPVGHHLTSFIIHALNAFLVVLLSVQLLKRSGAAAFSRITSSPLSPEFALVLAATLTGLFFGVHPLHVESVAWVAERKDLLCAFFFLLSLLLYIRYTEQEQSVHADQPAARTRTKRTYLYSACILSFVLALLSKPMAVTLPVVLLLLDWFPLGRPRQGAFRGLFLEKAPFFLLSLLSSVITVKAQGAGGSIATVEALPLLSRTAAAFKALCMYVVKMFFPCNLIPFYPHPGEIAIFSPHYLFPAILIILVTAAAIIRARKERGWLAVWASYLIMAAPVIGIVQVGNQAMADRYTYLPTLGLFLLLSVGLTMLVAKMLKALGPLAAAAVPSAVVVALMFMTVQQTGIWKSSETLWKSVIRVEPGVSAAYNNLGVILLAQNRVKDALVFFDAAIQLDPANADTLSNMAICHLEERQYEEARLRATQALKIKPLHAGAHSTLGETWFATGNYQQALDYFQRALQLDSGKPVRYFNVALSLDKLGRIKEACGYWGTYLRSGLDSSKQKEVYDHMKELHCSEQAVPPHS